MTLRSRALLLVAVVACGAGCAPSDEPSASADPSAGAGPSGNAHQDANAHETVQTRPRGTVSNIVLPETEGCAERDGLDHELAFIDPTLDGFGTEVLNSSAGKALKHLAVGLAADLPAEELETYVAPEFESRGLRSAKMEARFGGDGLTVARGGEATGEFSGHAGLAAALRELGRPYDAEDLHFKFKIVRIEEHPDDEATTEAIYLATGTGPDGYTQQNATWTLRWDVSGGYDHPRLLRVEIEEFEENQVPRQLYSDCSESVFAAPETRERIRHGIHSWWGRIDTGMGFSFYGDYTMAVGDVDGDGLDDLYVCQPGSLPNLLLRHLADGTLVDISAGSGADILDDTPSALIADMNNDGHQDLVVASGLAIDFMAGDGTGRFRLASTHPTDNTLSLSTADYDGDGLLDIYICRYSTFDRGAAAGDSIYDSNQGKPNVLLRNGGGFAFTDATEESGLSHNNHKFSFSGVWEDYDNDGDPDLYVANDFGRNNLYRNDGGLFQDVARESGAEDMAAGMGATWADYDLDGSMDLYVSNMFSSAGGRIIDKPNIEALAGSEAVAPLQRFAKGNTLLANRGDGTFEDVSFQAGITMGRWSWGGEFLDVNNDSWQDLVVPNGFVTNDKSQDL